MRTDFLRRIEKLEATNPLATERVRLAVRFSGAKDGKPVDVLPARAWSGSAQPIIRSPNETGDAFEERAFAHFAALDDSPHPLVVMLD